MRHRMLLVCAGSEWVWGITTEAKRPGPNNSQWAYSPPVPPCLCVCVCWGGEGGLQLLLLISNMAAAAPQRRRREGQCTPLQSTPRDICAQVADGPRPSNNAHPAMAPTRPRRHAPRLLPTPELTPTQKWWAAFVCDRAFARARAAGKNATKAGHAEADIARSLPDEYRDLKMTRERNISRTQPSRQPDPGGATDAHAPTPPAACDRNALSAL